MLHSYNELKQFAIRATDKPKGQVDDFYFDDETWKIRYLVVQTGFLLTGRQVLVGADLLEQPDMEALEFPVAVSTEDLEEGVTPEQVSPVSQQRKRQQDSEMLPDWPTFLIGMHSARITPLLAEEQLRERRRELAKERDVASDIPEDTGDPHLRSMQEVSGYSLRADDGEIGSVNDFLVDPQDWTLHYVVIDTGKWFSGKRVVLTTNRIRGIDAEAQILSVDLSSSEIKAAPPLESLEDVKHSSVHEVLQKYGPMGYWPAGL